MGQGWERKVGRQIAEDHQKGSCYSFKGANTVVQVPVLMVEARRGGFQVLMGDLTGLADGLDMKGNTKRGLQDDSQVCGQATGQCGR